MLSGCREVLHSELPMACVAVDVPREDHVSSNREQGHCGNSVPDWGIEGLCGDSSDEHFEPKRRAFWIGQAIIAHLPVFRRLWWNSWNCLVFTACCLFARTLVRIVEVAHLYFFYFPIGMGGAHRIDSVHGQFNCRNNNESLQIRGCIQFTPKFHIQ